ncbi:MAG: hypothetical protein PVI00_15455 [Desulfobacterales bacterium]
MPVGPVAAEKTRPALEKPKNGLNRLNLKRGVQMGNDPKSAAAIAAVLQYIKTEEEAIAMHSAMAAPLPQMPASARQPAPVMKPWGVSGRQAQMQMRNLMQMRTFRKL